MYYSFTVQFHVIEHIKMQKKIYPFFIIVRRGCIKFKIRHTIQIAWPLVKDDVNLSCQY